MIHIDTSFLVRALVGGSAEDTQLREWLADDEHLCMSALAWAEFLAGPARDGEELASELIGHRAEFSDAHAEIAARLFNETGRAPGTFVDCLVAAAALADDAPLATANAASYRRFEPSGLIVLEAGDERPRDPTLAD